MILRELEIIPIPINFKIRFEMNVSLGFSYLVTQYGLLNYLQTPINTIV